jgi:hypothetical protein
MRRFIAHSRSFSPSQLIFLLLRAGVVLTGNLLPGHIIVFWFFSPSLQREARDSSVISFDKEPKKEV